MSNNDEKDRITLPGAVARGTGVMIGATPTIATAQGRHLWQAQA